VHIKSLHIIIIIFCVISPKALAFEANYMHDKPIEARPICIRFMTADARFRLIPPNWPNSSFHYSNCATLRGHLSNRRALC